MLIQYFKKGKCTPRKKGVLVAVPADEIKKVVIGYSLCNFKMGDKFEKDFGKKVAIERALSGRPLKIPSSMKTSFEKFKRRCERYFKDYEVVDRLDKSQKSQVA